MDENGSVLKEALNIADLLGENGAQFQISTKYNDHGEEFFMEDDYGSADEDEDAHRKIMNPWDKSFDELRGQMFMVSEFVYKRITKPGVGDELVPDRARVKIDYNGYFEGETYAFDSTSMRGEFKTFTIGKSEVLEGLEEAVKSMKPSEEAQFVIGYQVLFGELGCKPRIKPKADALFIVKLVSFTDPGDAAALDNLTPEEQRSYAVVKQKVVDTRNHAKDYFKKNLVANAINDYHKAVNYLEQCNIKDEAEQLEQTETLIQIYTSLAVCYNKKDNPRKACLMINEIRRLGNLERLPRALFHEGRALMNLGEYGRAKTSLVKAQKLEPTNKEIAKELKILNERWEKSRQDEQSICARAFGLKERKDIRLTEEQISFTNTMKGTLEAFTADERSKQLTLPEGLTSKEMDMVQDLADQFGLRLNLYKDNNKDFYRLEKKSTAKKDEE
ncbi:FK506-binding protein 6 [Culex quinquefasciatus]|uniref:peptidylprolyl isomerase n=4 Tax=Culex pipiens complex TaxID=518105 RepID=B0WGW1_CULQU|nr:inactive peptidyl-prolyl cis-trans isomerase shutdown [Culex pipiens pallens]EDS27255.1 FK506-binding protein 6 [Culex quinquefasciatus]|eukprot:XP_001847945.1 FK506-binding protein 6 [Culex quinquefasciatus]